MPSYSTRDHLPEWMYGNRLSPDEEGRKQTMIFDARAAEGLDRAWNAEFRRGMRRAIDNPARLPDYSFAAHQWFADNVRMPDEDEPSWRPGPEERLPSDQPSVVVGWDESVGAIYLPKFAHGVSLTNFVNATEVHMNLDLPPIPPGLLSKRGKVATRHAHDINRYDMGKAGCRHYGVWHEKGHQHSDSLQPTRDTTRSDSNVQFGSRVQFLDAMHPMDGRVKHMMEVIRPDMFGLLRKTRERLPEHPGFRPFHECWHSVFPGRAVVFNRQSGVHMDRLGVRRGWDVLIAGGEFTGGELYLKDSNVYIPFLPGDLIAFDGTAQRHEIMPFSGTLRFSHVYFVHQLVLNDLGISSRLEDVYLSDLKDRMAPFTRPPPVQGPALPPGFQRPKGNKRAMVDNPERRKKRHKKARK